MNTAFTNGWLGFELSVLRRLKFSSIALPFTGEPGLAIQLRRWKVRVAANDPLMWSYVKATALVENDSQRLSDEQINTILDDAYVPRDRLDNPSMQKWFNEADCWWFDTVRFNAERLESHYQRALALTLGMMVGDYVLSFDEKTRQLREPLGLSTVYRQMAEMLPFPYDNSLRSRAFNLDVRSFLAERQHTDLLFLRLPTPLIQSAERNEVVAWREEWLRGADDFWNELAASNADKLGGHARSKQQYLSFVEDVLERSAHIPSWAIALMENGFITTEELVETISRIRKTDTVYTKDFSDLLGVRASIVTSEG